MQMSVNINNKILLTVIPIFSLVIGIYFLFEILRTHTQFQEDFDSSIERSIKILEPTLANNIYNLEQNNTNSSLNGLFNNKNLETAIVFTDNGQFFAGVKKIKNEVFENFTDKEKLDKYTKISSLKTLHELVIVDLKNGQRRYISSIFSAEKDKNNLHGSQAHWRTYM